MSIKADEISKIIKDRLSSFSATQDLSETGFVLSVGDGYAGRGLLDLVEGTVIPLTDQSGGLCLT